MPSQQAGDDREALAADGAGEAAARELASKTSPGGMPSHQAGDGHVALAAGGAGERNHAPMHPKPMEPRAEP
eukprot:2484415-Alexandrium_andersonii.AAC.1